MKYKNAIIFLLRKYVFFIKTFKIWYMREIEPDFFLQSR